MVICNMWNIAPVQGHRQGTILILFTNATIYSAKYNFAM